jgi:ATP-dependent Clp protease ATP-binding subunit ClpX
LDEEALVQILTEPRNAITKQYMKLFEFDGIELEFEPDALREVAKIALKRKTGARGLRAILEQTMLDVMYEMPSKDNIYKCLVTKDSISGKESPRMIEGKKKFTPENKPTMTPAKDVENAS